MSSDGAAAPTDKESLKATIRGIRQRKREIKKELASTEAELTEAQLTREMHKGTVQHPGRILKAYNGDFDKYRKDYVDFRYTTAQRQVFHMKALEPLEDSMRK